MVESEEKRTPNLCSFCGKKLDLFYRCKYCGKIFCEEHIPPSRHNCDQSRYEDLQLLSNQEAWSRFTESYINIVDPEYKETIEYKTSRAFKWLFSSSYTDTDILRESKIHKRSRATAIVEMRKGILLVSHSKHSHPTYMLPGGGIRKGEDPIKAVERELYEETGLRSSKVQSLFSFDTTHNRHKVFLIEPHGRLRKRHETTHIRFYNKSTEGKYKLAPHVKPIIEEYRSLKKQIEPKSESFRIKSRSHIPRARMSGVPQEMRNERVSLTNWYRGRKISYNIKKLTIGIGNSLFLIIMSLPVLDSFQLIWSSPLSFSRTFLPKWWELFPSEFPVPSINLLLVYSIMIISFCLCVALFLFNMLNKTYGFRRIKLRHYFYVTICSIPFLYFFSGARFFWVNSVIGWVCELVR